MFAKQLIPSVMSTFENYDKNIFVGNRISLHVNFVKVSLNVKSSLIKICTIVV